MEHPFNKTLTPNELPNSLWAATAEPALPTSSLAKDEIADVVIIGGGILGLSTALHLSQQGQNNIICLEATEIGWGASGRNNGQVIAGLKHDPTKVYEMLNKSSADTLIQCSSEAPDLVFSLIEKNTISCDAIRKGWIQPAPSKRAEKEILSRMQQWESLGAPVEMLDKGSLSERLGTSWYQAAWLDRRGGSVNPLAYTRGLANAVIRSGVSLFTHTPVIEYRQNTSGTWEVLTKKGKITANQLVIATNAYIGELAGKFRKSIIPVRTAQIASEPLATEDWQKILPQGEAASDASHLLTSFRITPEKRLVMGGAYATGGDENQAMFDALKRAAKNRFPFIKNINWQYKWSGYLAITPPHLPQIYTLGERCYAPIGCNGRGIAMSTMTGKQLAQLIIHENTQACAIPIVAPTAHQFHRFRNLGIAANVSFANFRDKYRI